MLDAAPHEPPDWLMMGGNEGSKALFRWSGRTLPASMLRFMRSTIFFAAFMFTVGLGLGKSGYFSRSQVPGCATAARQKNTKTKSRPPLRSTCKGEDGML